MNNTFNIKKYMGVWYEISKYENQFEKNCSHSSSYYILNSDDTVYVLNTCYNDEWKRISSIEGTAYQIQNNKFHVKFFEFDKSNDANYIVLRTDYEYYAIVGSNDKNYLWILCRNKMMSSKKYNKLLEFCEKIGYDTNKLVLNDNSKLFLNEF